MHLCVETAGPANAEISFVFIHGPGLDHTYFRPYLDPLADRYRLVFYDQRISGQSPRTSERAVDLDVMANDAIAVIHDAGPSRSVLVAHSYSAWIAIRAAVQAESPVAGLVLVSPGMSPTAGETLMAHIIRHGTAEQRRYVETGFSGGLTTDGMFGDAWRSIMPLYFLRFDQQQADAFLGRISFSAAAFNAFLASGFNMFDWQQAARQLRLPVLVCGGAHDWLETDRTGGSRAVAEAFPEADFHLFERSGHFCFIEEPDSVVSRLRAWASDRRSSLLTGGRSA